jgi:hypothetical protein
LQLNAMPLVRQAKLGVSCGVRVPAEQGLANHSYRGLRMGRRQEPNEPCEAYPGNHVSRRGVRTP